MRPRVKRATKKAGKLHGATAQFLSIVDRGANETPFTLIKTANGASAMGIKKRGKKSLNKSHKQVATRKKDADTSNDTVIEMAKMVFDGELFSTEQEVLDKVAEMEWDAEGLSVTKVDDNWEVRAGDTSDDAYSRLEKVDTEEDGIEAYVGERSIENDDSSEEEVEVEEDAEEESTEEVETEKKSTKKVLSKRAKFLATRKEASKEQIAKFDKWDVYYSSGNTIAKALSDGMKYDKMPPGFYDVQAAFNAVLSNIVADEGMSDKKEALDKAATDFTEIVYSMDMFFTDYVEADEEMVSKVASDESEREHLAKWADDFGDFAAGKVVVSKSETTAEVDYNKISKTVADLVTKAIKPLAKSVEAVSGTVEEIASRRPTKKAVDPDALGSNKVAKKEDANEEWDRIKASKSLLG